MRKYDNLIVISAVIAVVLLCVGGLANSPVIMGLGLLALAPVLLVIVIGAIGLILNLPREILEQVRRGK